MFDFEAMVVSFLYEKINLNKFNLGNKQKNLLMAQEVFFLIIIA